MPKCEVIATGVPINLLDIESYAFLNMDSWSKVYSNGHLLRSSRWYTCDPCKCSYEYGNGTWPSFVMPELVLQLGKCIAEQLSSVMNEQFVPNCVNANYYVGSSSSLGWHSDKEDLFPDDDGCATIVSVSLGQSRNFEFRKIGGHSKPRIVTLNNGDVLVMAGKTQLFWEHRVPPLDNLFCQSGEPRLNFTFRFARNHERKCPCSSPASSSAQATTQEPCRNSGSGHS